MKGRPPKDLPASVRYRLLALSKEMGTDFQSVLIRYALERLMYRLSRSRYGPQFVLKGALLFEVWSDDRFRATLDMDFLHLGIIGTSELGEIFRAACIEKVEEDGVICLPESVRAEEIREDQVYGGIRITLMALLGTARAPLQVDVGLGDSVSPAPEEIEFPTLLGNPAPRLLVYSRETAIAEKFEALVSLGMPNSRMKDFFDLWVLSRRFRFDGEVLAGSIAATLKRRGTALSGEVPVALSPTFSTDPTKRIQWEGFLKRGHLALPAPGLPEVIEGVASFLLPLAASLATGNRFAGVWAPGGPWGPKG